jgi:hypothetical protein
MFVFIFILLGLFDESIYQPNSLIFTLWEINLKHEINR